MRSLRQIAFLIVACALPTLAVAQQGGVVGTSLADGFVTVTFTTLPTTSDSHVAWCSNCAEGSFPCTGSSTGSYAFRIGGAWVCPTVSAAAGSSAPFSDATAITKNASDATKTVTIDASGLTTGTNTTLKGRNTGFGIGTATTAVATADNLIAASATGAIGLVIEAKASPTVDWFAVVPSTAAGTRGLHVNSDGGVIINQHTTATYASSLQVGSQDVTDFSVGNTGGVSGTFRQGINASGGAFLVSSAGWVQETGRCFVTADQTNATTTMQTSTCSVTVVSGKKYSFQCELFLSDSVAVDGAKMDFNGGAATATNFRAQVTAFDTALNLSSQVTALATASSASTFTGAGAFEVHGTFEPSANGTFIPRFAQVSHSTGTLTLARGSNCIFRDIP